MKRRYARWLSLPATLFMIIIYCTIAQAALLDVGPTVPQVIPSSAPTLGHGFPAWYRDTNRVPLEPCYSTASLPSGPACILLADAGFNPVNPIVFPTNFPSEAFYSIADALINVPAGVIKYRAGLEAAFGTGVASPGGQITFARIRVTADLPVAGTYKFTHPYGVETLVAAAPGKRAITFTRDVGVGAFTGAVAGDLGPWLTMTGFPQTIVTAGGNETFIGDPNIPNTVTGSPLNTNFFRVDGPVGANLDGLGNNFVQTNLFTVAGKMLATGIGTPMTVDRATYIRDAANTEVDVFVTTLPISNVTTGVPPNPLALANIPSVLQFSDATATIPLTAMETNNAKDGKFYATRSIPSPAAMPPTITVTNISDVPPSSTTVLLVDEVVITEASYKSTTPSTTPGTLKVVAASGDSVDLPLLTVSMKDGLQDVPLGTIAGGSGTLAVGFPFVYSIPAALGGGTKTYNIPPENVTVTSANKGSNTELVTSPLSQAPLAVNDTATVAPGGSVIINVAANDTTPVVGRTVVAASVAIVTPPAKGGAVNNGDGTITYTNVQPSSGTDTFTYTILDSIGLISNVGTVTVTITNAPPVASPFTAVTNEDTPIVINVAGLPTIDPDTALNPHNAVAPATVAITVAPLHGVATPLGDGTVRYTPNLNYNNTALTADSFAYTVRDTLGAVSNAAVVSITVNPVPDAPLALNDFATTPQNTAVTINVLANDSHPDAPVSGLDPTTLAVTNLPTTAGVASVVAGQVSFAPTAGFSGTTSFTYTVSDNATPVLTSLPATVTVTVTPIATPPIANPDVASTFVNTARIVSVLANDTPGTNPINSATVTIVGVPTNGTVVVNSNGTVTFTPTIAVPGTGTFSYTVKDNTGVVSNIALVTVSIASAVTDSVTVLQAQFTVSKSDWLVQGTTTGAPLGTVVTIIAGSNLTGQIIGTIPVDAAGRWKFQSATTGVPQAATISVKLPSGASRLAFPVAVK